MGLGDERGAGGLAGKRRRHRAGPAADVRAWRKAHETEIVRELADLVALPNLARDASSIRVNADRLVAMLDRRRDGGAPARGRGRARRRSTASGRSRARAARSSSTPTTTASPSIPAKWHGEPWTPILRDGPLEDGRRRDPASDRVPYRPGGAALRPLGARRQGADRRHPRRPRRAARARPPTGRQRQAVPRGRGGGRLAAPARRSSRSIATQLAADAWLLCDGPVHQTRRMQVFFGARGVTDLELTLYGPARPLHSGHYGNWAPNPALELAHLVAGLRDVDGAVQVAGFYDDVRPPTETREAGARARCRTWTRRCRGELALGAHRGRRRAAGRADPPARAERARPRLRSASGGRPRTPFRPRPAPPSTSAWCPTRRRRRVREQVEAHLRKLGYDIVHGEADAARRGASARGCPASRLGTGLSGRAHVDGPALLAGARARGRGGHRARRVVRAAHARRQRAAWSCSRASWTGRSSACRSSTTTTTSTPRTRTCACRTSGTGSRSTRR